MRAGARALRLAAVALLGVALLAGCAGIPTAGPVGTRSIDGGEDGDDLVTLADRPQAGATPEQLVLGFLRAQRAPQDNYLVAREFLTDEFRTAWKPTSGVVITDTPIAPVEIAEDIVTATVRIDAVVDSTGVYSELADPPIETLRYEFARNADGEWRIASAPDGTLVPTGRFTSTFVASPLFFYDPSGRYLVPDMRWFPNTTSRADRIVTELLRGQSEWYAQGVLVTAFPAGTALRGITAVGGRTSVDLSGGDIGSLPATERGRMQQQLRASLATLTDSSSVQMTVDGFAVDVGDGAMPDLVQSVSAKTLGLAEGGFGFLSRDAVEALPGLSDATQALSPLGATLARGGGALAVRSADGVRLVRVDADPVLVDDRPGLVDPSIDGAGYVWSVPADDPGSILAIDASAAPHPIPVTYLDGTVVSLDVSRDGARLLVALQRSTGPAVWIVGIVRDADGVPVGFGTPLPLTVADTPLLDASWVDAATIATLTESSEGSRVDLYRIGGRHEPFGIIENGAQLVGGNSADGIRVRDADGVVWRRTSSGGWQPSGIVASFLATQQ